MLTLNGASHFHSCYQSLSDDLFIASRSFLCLRRTDLVQHSLESRIELLCVVLRTSRIPSSRATLALVGLLPYNINWQSQQFGELYKNCEPRHNGRQLPWW